MGSACRVKLYCRFPVASIKTTCGVLDAITQNFGGFGAGSKGANESRLLKAIQNTRQGLDTSPAQKTEILAAVEELVELGSGSATTSSSNINATWKLLWTTEKVGGLL